jgi:quinol monooxygenase YgiN
MTTTEKDAAIRKTVFLIAKPGVEEQLRQALIVLQDATRQESGCNIFSFYGALDNPGSFLLVEDFANSEAFRAHLQLPHTKTFFAAGLTSEITVFQ